VGSVVVDVLVSGVGFVWEGVRVFGGGATRAFKTVAATPLAPYQLPLKSGTASNKTPTVTLRWTTPAGDVRSYQIYRVSGSIVDATQFSKRKVVGQTAPPLANTITDDKVSPGATYTYFVTARFLDGGGSGMSNFRTITVPK